MRDQLRAEHAVSELSHFLGSSSQLYSAGLTATAGMHLRLDYPQFAAKLIGSIGCCIGRLRRNPAGYRNAVVGEQSFRLVFVQIHRFVRLVAGELAASRSAVKNPAYFGAKPLRTQSNTRFGDWSALRASKR